MKTKEITVPYFLHKAKNHPTMKEYYLKEIKRGPINKYGSIYNTDWHVKSHINYSFFINQIQGNLNEMVKFFKVKECIFHNAWFQQYKKNSFHSWHTHCNAHYTNVYYLEGGQGKTEVRDPFTLKTLKMDVKEGDILSLPAFLLHRSPTFKTNTTKTIIAFNTSFLSLNDEDI